MTNEYATYIRETFTDATDEQVAALGERLDRFRLDTIKVEQFDQSKINIVNVDTGMLPKAKAEEYLRNVSKLFSTKFGSEVHALIVGFSSQQGPCTVVPLKKDKAFIVKVPVGFMGQSAVDEYMTPFNVYSERLAEAGYSVAFVPLHANQPDYQIIE